MGCEARRRARASHGALGVWLGEGRVVGRRESGGARGRCVVRSARCDATRLVWRGARCGARTRRAVRDTSWGWGRAAQCGTCQRHTIATAVAIVVIILLIVITLAYGAAASQRIHDYNTRSTKAAHVIHVQPTHRTRITYFTAEPAELLSRAPRRRPPWPLKDAARGPRSLGGRAVAWIRILEGPLMPHELEATEIRVPSDREECRDEWGEWHWHGADCPSDACAQRQRTSCGTSRDQRGSSRSSQGGCQS